MSTILLTVKNNQAPDFQITLKRDGTAINLTGATVKVYIRKEMADVFTNTGHETVTITTAASGIITYSPQANDFPSEGRYLAEAEITYSGGDVERVYELVTISVRDSL